MNLYIAKTMYKQKIKEKLVNNFNFQVYKVNGEILLNA